MRSICFFFIGQIGFAVILLIFLYYFATILILGAQINAFFFENYKPLVDGLGTYINQMHVEHGADDANRPLINDETDDRRRSSGTTTTTTASRTPHRNVWLNKLWPSKTTSTDEQEENNA